MRIVCRIRGHHRWLMGGSVSEIIPTSDICLTCRERTTWPPYAACDVINMSERASGLSGISNGKADHG